MGYDPYVIQPCKECEKYTEDVLWNVSKITNVPYEDVENRFNKLLEELKNGQR